MQEGKKRDEVKSKIKLLNSFNSLPIIIKKEKDGLSIRPTIKGYNPKKKGSEKK